MDNFKMNLLSIPYILSRQILSNQYKCTQYLYSSRNMLVKVGLTNSVHIIYVYKISITILTLISLPSGVTPSITRTIESVTTITGVVTSVSTIVSKKSVRARYIKHMAYEANTYIESDSGIQSIE